MLTHSQCNQIANYAYTQEEINIKIGNKHRRELMPAKVRAYYEGL